MFPLNRSDFVKLVDHGVTYWRHWRANEMQQFNNSGPVVRIGARSFRIYHERSNQPGDMFPRPGLQTYILVAECLWSRLKNNFLGRGAATEVNFLAAIETHIANQKGWLNMVKPRPVAENVKSVLEHTNIFRVYFVSPHE